MLSHFTIEQQSSHGVFFEMCFFSIPGKNRKIKERKQTPKLCSEMEFICPRWPIGLHLEFVYSNIW